MTTLSKTETAWLAVCLGVALLGVAAWVAATGSSDPEPHTPEPWPAIVRTVDGVVTTPMPEDLDR